MTKIITRTLLWIVVALTAALPGRINAASTYVPNGLSAPGSIVNGIYPGTDPGNCCWMGAHAELRVSPPREADTVLFNIYLPPFAAQPGGQGLRVAIGGAAPQERCCLDPGEHELAFSLPPHVAGRVNVPIHVDARGTFVPAQRGLNADPRALSVLVRDVAFLNSRSGERFDPAPAPWLSARIAWPLLAACSIVILLATLKRPIFGLAALLLTDPFLLAAYIHGTTITLPKVAIAAVAIGLVPRLSARARPSLSPALRMLALAQFAFILTMGVASIHAPFHAAALRETLKACEYLATLGLAYLAYALDPDERVVRASVVAVVLIVVLPALAQLRLGAPQTETILGHTVARIAGSLEGPNQLAGFLGITVPVMLAFALRRTAWAIERAAIILGIITCALTFSRSGFAALVFTLALMVALAAFPGRRGALAIGALALFMLMSVLAFCAFAGGAHAPFASLFGASSDRFNGGLGSRPDLWHAAFVLWRAHPFFGIGPGNFELAVGRLDPGIRTHANGMYFQVLAEQGLLGLVAFAGVEYASVVAFIRRLDHPLALGAIMGSLALAFHQIADCIAIYPKVGVIWWIILGIGAASLAQAPRDARAATPTYVPDGT